MLKRYIKISNHLPGPVVDKINDLILNNSEPDNGKALCRKLEALVTVTIAIHGGSSALAKAILL